MRSLARVVAEISLVLAVVALALAQAIPWPQEPGVPNDKAAGVHTLPTAQSASPPVSRASPERVAALFGWTAPEEAVQEPPSASDTPPEEPSATPQRQPQRASWLAFVGYVADADGRPLYYLKDTRSGKIIGVGPGHTPAGWSLLSATEDTVVVRFEDEAYAVSRR